MASTPSFSPWSQMAESSEQDPNALPEQPKVSDTGTKRDFGNMLNQKSVTGSGATTHVNKHGSHKRKRKY